MSDLHHYTDTQVIERVKTLTGQFTYLELGRMYDCSAVDFWRACHEGIIRPALRRALDMEQDKPPRYRLALEFDTGAERNRMQALLAEWGETRKEQSRRLLELLEEMT